MTTTESTNISTRGLPQRCSALFSSNFLLLSRASLISQNRWNHNRPPPPSVPPLLSFSLLYISLCSGSQPAPGTPVLVCSSMPPRVCVRVFCAKCFLVQRVRLAWTYSVSGCVELWAYMYAMKYSGNRQPLWSWKSLFLQRFSSFSAGACNYATRSFSTDSPQYSCLFCSSYLT